VLPVEGLRGQRVWEAKTIVRQQALRWNRDEPGEERLACPDWVRTAPTVAPTMSSCLADRVRCDASPKTNATRKVRTLSNERSDAAHRLRSGSDRAASSQVIKQLHKRVRVSEHQSH
jgi:hypothetical protein